MHVRLAAIPGSPIAANSAHLVTIDVGARSQLVEIIFGRSACSVDSVTIDSLGGGRRTIMGGASKHAHFDLSTDERAFPLAKPELVRNGSVYIHVTNDGPTELMGPDITPVIEQA